MKQSRFTDEQIIVITPAIGPQEAAIDALALADLALPHYQLGLFIFTKTTHE